MTNTDSTAREVLKALLESLQGQLAVYRQLLELVRRQRKEIDADDLDAVVDTLEQKQQLIESVTQQEERLAPLRKQWEEKREEVTEEERVPLQAVVSSLKEVMEELLQADAENEIDLRRKSKELAESIERVHKTRRAMQAYGVAPPDSPKDPESAGPARFLDVTE